MDRAEDSERTVRSVGFRAPAAALAKGAGQESNGHFYDFDYPVVGDDGEETPRAREWLGGPGGPRYGPARRRSERRSDDMASKPVFVSPTLA